MSPIWNIGRTGLVYLCEESAYAVSTAFSGSNAFRHLDVHLTWDPHQLAKSPERHAHPSQTVMLTRRQKASWSLKGQMYPSGTINTLPECDLLLKNAIGQAAANITLSTTLTAAAKTTTSGTVASASGLAVGQFIQITMLGGSAPGTYGRFLTAVAGAVLTWAPPLPTAPATSDTVLGGVTYAPATNPPKSLDICHYPQAPATGAPKREQLGCVCDKLTIAVDSNTEPMLTVSGMASGFAPSPQSQPGSFTTVGAENGIPSGLTGSFWFNNVLYQVEKVQIDLSNTMDVQNTALGTSTSSGFFRKGKRAVAIKFDAKVSDDLTAWNQGLSSAQTPLFLQVGTTGGKIWCVYLPNVVVNLPDTPDGDETNNWAFTGFALATAAGNDELFVGML